MKKRLFFLFCFAPYAYTMNKSLAKLEDSPLSKEIIQNYLLQFQKEPPSHENSSFENLLKVFIGKSKAENTRIEFKTSYIGRRDDLTTSTKSSLFNKIMEIIQQKSIDESRDIIIDEYTKAQKPRLCNDTKNWHVLCTTRISFHELAVFIHNTL